MVQHTREDVLRIFPDLADPTFVHPDDPNITAEDSIQEWIAYWTSLQKIMDGDYKAPIPTIPKLPFKVIKGE